MMMKRCTRDLVEVNVNIVEPAKIDVQTDEIAAYHHVLAQMSTTHIEKRGEI
ncbi:hypothetical protein A2U01_0026593, partial [Trifolium medium]|nr:hypothetical protein [Trifolium medium]